MALIATSVLVLVIVTVRVLVPPTGIDVGLNALVTVGAPAAPTV